MTTQDPTPAPLLRVVDVTKRFPGVLALDKVNLALKRGAIHGLAGENGAGKSTLLKILAGDYRPTSGRIELDGEEVTISTPRQAHALGIGIVYQELSLLTNLSVASNMSLANEPTRGIAINERTLEERARTVLKRIGITNIDPRRKVATLSLAERQLVEIAKVLTLRDPRVLIFDEPTAALGQADVDRLFRIMRSLRDEGVGIFFVTHRYRELLSICDRATVIRNGQVVADVSCPGATIEHLVELTLGKSGTAVFSRSLRAAELAETVLEAKGLQVGSKVRGVDLVLRRGEILGMCGLLGSGQNEIARALAGDAAEVEGTIIVNARPAVASSPRRAFRAGLSLITENRQEEGLFPDMSVRSNISIASLGRVVLGTAFRLIRSRKERQLTNTVAGRTGIQRSYLPRRIRLLSGGNQQKSLLARWLMRGSDVFILIEPTRGVDVGAKIEIYERLEELARDGAAVLVVSTDIPEIMGLSDRLAVVYQGEILTCLDPRMASEQDVLLAIQGGTTDAAVAEVVG